MKSLVRCVLAALTLVCAATLAFAADVGDDAPALTIEEWVQGGPVELKPGENTYLVLFWATYNGPSVKALVDLEEQIEKHKGKKLVVVGMTVEKPKSVGDWIAGRDKKPSFAIGADKYQNTWGEYIGKKGSPPQAFIIHKTGKIAWSGVPGEKMNELLGEILDGTYNMESARAKQESEKGLQESLAKQDWAGAKTHAAKIVALEPENSWARRMLRFTCEHEKDPDTYHKAIRACVDGVNENATLLNELAWNLATDNDWEWRDLGTALVASQKAMKAMKEPKMKASIIDTYARVCYLLGNVELAIKEQRRALKEHESREIEDGKQDEHKKEGDGLKDTLTYYEKINAAAKLLPR